LPACRKIVRLTRHLVGLGAGCEYAGVELEENKALVHRYIRRFSPGTTAIFSRGCLIPPS
jgi:hypothetical protein